MNNNEIITITDDDVKLYQQYGGKLPSKYEPNSMYVPFSSDPWDKYETEQYESDYPYCLIHWSRIVSFIKRYKKLKEKHKIDVNYCNKCERKYNKIQQSKMIQYIYIGTILNE